VSPLADQEHRDRIRTDTASTLFVEAGAGSGKTSALVERVTTLVLRDDVPLHDIAAVTFTEKAGAELRDRLREAFEKARRARDGSARSVRARTALEDLDAAAIGTLHAFAQRLLTGHPIEAALPPLIEVLDEVASSVSFEERWQALRVQLLDDDDLADTLLVALSAGITLDHLRSLARAFGADWDLIDDRVLSAPAPAAPVLPDLQPLVEDAARLLAQREHCRDDADLFIDPLLRLGAWGRRLAVAGDAGQQLEVLVQARDLKWGGGGRIANWGCDLAGLKAECKELQQRAAGLVARANDAALRVLAHRIAGQVRVAADARRAEGRLEFHDLLVLARDLLRHDKDVRATLQQRYRRLLLDEFQDTDPIQIELAVRIAGGAQAEQPRWEDVAVPPGSLFVVGDPKQSIYRFRRADIAMYLCAQDRIGERVALSTNFRTVAPVLDWVNSVFAELIQPVAGAQPSYQRLDRFRDRPPHGPAVVVLGADAHADKPSAATLREREAVDVAAVIRQALDEQWSVCGRAQGSWRPVRLGDIAVLIPARTSLPFLEDALDTAGVPYRAESSSLVYQAGEVRDLLASARAVADPSDALSLVTALRSPLFGCGDDDLWSWKQARGAFNLLAPAPDALEAHPVAQALDYLARLHRRARWLTPSELLGALVDDRRMLEVAAGGPRARDQWRRLRFVVDQARAWSEVEHGGLRAYLDWAARQGEETSRVAEAVLPETDTDAVRVMTVHAAKGLEFPLVILSGMSSQPRSAHGVQLLWPPGGGYAVGLNKQVQTNDFEAVKPVDEQMDAFERRRLLYVASTRARDHLVVSLHRSQRSRDSTKATNAELLADAGAAVAGAVAFTGAIATPDTVVAEPVEPPPEWASWLAGVQSSRAASRWVSALSASGLEGSEPAVALNETKEPPGAAKGARDVELPPWSKGRYGSAVGRAVHGVLQSVDLVSGAGLDDAVAAQCVAEGVVDYAAVVRALAGSALDSDVVRRAAAREHWRESYVGTVRADGTVLEGFVDLIYRDDDGALVVVDYKTDAVPTAALDARVAYYAPQLAAYVEALDAATRGHARAVALFLSPDRALARDVP
jgi:ATP-dependent exoDNAse (exonuclease V) beta subunit